MATINSPLRYPGGKTKALRQIIPYLPARFSSYREPFVGGGAVFIASAPDVRDGHWYGRNYLRETGGGPSKNQVAAIFGVTAAIAGVTGIGLMLWHPDPEQPKVAVGLAPTGLVVSGSLP